MKIPTTLKIFGYTYQVILEDRKRKRGVEAPATCNSGQHKIWIDINQCQEEQETCLLHEILEAFDYHFNLELPHKTIATLEAGLYQVLRENNLRF